MNTDPRINDPWADQRVTAYALGELEPSEAARFEEEMDRSPALAAAVQEACALTGQLKDWFAREPIRSLDGERREAFLSSLSQPGTSCGPSAAAVASASLASAAESPTAAGSLFRSRSPALRWFVLAASLLLVVGAVAYQLSGRGEPGDVRGLALGDAAKSTQQPSTPRPAELGLERAPAREASDKRLLEREWAEQGLLLREPVGPADAEMAASESHFSPATTNGLPLGPSEPLQRGVRDASPGDIADPTSARSMRQQANTSEESLLAAEPFYETLPKQSRLLAEDFAESPAAAPAPARPAARARRSLDGAYGGREEAMAQPERLQRAAAGEDLDGGGLGDIGYSVAAADMAPHADYFQAEVAAVRGGGVAMPAEPRRIERLALLEPTERPDEGRGPGMAGDRFDVITENAFKRVEEHALSTFSVDVDTAAYAKVRQFLSETGRLPRPDVVRIEELVNYFDYGYAGPPADAPHPFAADIEIAQCPWNTEHRLARIAIQAKRVAAADRPACNLVFLIDTSGSMNAPNRLPLVQRGLEMLLDQLHERDRVAIVVYAGSAGLVLDSTPASDVSKIRRALTRLQAGGSTNGGDGIRLAYQTARDHFIASGVNRVILCTDGDFNVGTTSQDELIRLVEQQARGGIDLTVLGFGMGNHNDAMLEQISGKANGNYAFIDNQQEARRVLVEKATSTLFTVARDVKIQVEFNPAKVAAYRLIGYENRMLAKEDFNDDTKDAGEIGAGHSVTALYELIPQNGDTHVLAPTVDPLEFQTAATLTDAAQGDTALVVKLRYKSIEKDGEITAAGQSESTLVKFTAADSAKPFAEASSSFRLAALVAAFGMQLRTSEHKGTWTLADVLREAAALGSDGDDARAEWIELVRRAAAMQTGEANR